MLILSVESKHFFQKEAIRSRCTTEHVLVHLRHITQRKDVSISHTLPFTPRK